MERLQSTGAELGRLRDAAKVTYGASVLAMLTVAVKRYREMAANRASTLTRHGAGTRGNSENGKPIPLRPGDHVLSDERSLSDEMPLGQAENGSQVDLVTGRDLGFERP